MTYQQIIDSGAVGDRWKNWREEKRDERAEKRAEQLSRVIDKTKEKVAEEKKKKLFPVLLVAGASLFVGYLIWR